MPHEVGKAGTLDLCQVGSFITEAGLTSSFKRKVKYFYDCFGGAITQYNSHITSVLQQCYFKQIFKT
jgi:hypothetical protein